MSGFTKRPLRSRATKNPLSTKRCTASDTVLRDTPKAAANVRLGGMGVPVGTQPSKMLRTIISLIRPCKVLLLPSKCGSHLTHMSVMEWAGRMGSIDVVLVPKKLHYGSIGSGDTAIAFTQTSTSSVRCKAPPKRRRHDR